MFVILKFHMVGEATVKEQPPYGLRLHLGTAGRGFIKGRVLGKLTG